MENSFETQASTSGNNLLNRSGENRQSGTKRRLQENGLPPAKYCASCSSRCNIFLGKKGRINFPHGVLYPERPTPFTRSKPRESCIVYVNGLPTDVTQEWIETMFGMWGPVKKILLMDKGTCYIKYFDESSAENSLCWSGFRLEIEKPNEDKYSGILCVDYAEGEFDQTHLKAFLKKNNISVPNENALEYVLSSFDEINISEPSLDEIDISEPSLNEINISEPSLDEINISEPSLDEINISERINHSSESGDLNRENNTTESLERDFGSDFCVGSELSDETEFTNNTNDVDENNQNDQDVEENDTENVASDDLVTDSFDISPSEFRILLFLFQHPFQSIDSIFSYLSGANVTINKETIENLMRRSPEVFKESVSGEGGKWYLDDSFYRVMTNVEKFL